MGPSGYKLAAFVLSVFLIGASSAAAKPARLDRKFADDGILRGPYLKAPRVNDLLIEPSGRLIVATRSLTLRYRSDGHRDRSWSAPGGAAGLAQDQSGHVLRVSGEVVERLLPDGGPDPRFGTNGLVRIAGADLTRVAIQPDGRVVVGGGLPGVTGFLLVRLTSSGRVDSSFGDEGKAITTITPPIGPEGEGGLDAMDSLAIEPSGAIVITGAAGHGAAAHCIHCFGPFMHAIVLGYTADGRLDDEFAAGGVFSSDESWGGATGLVLTDEGRSLFVTRPSPSEPQVVEPGFEVAALNSRGVLDSGFGEGGVSASLIRANGSGPESSAICALASGTIVVAGQDEFELGPGFRLEALHPDGSRDPRFGSRAFVTTPLGRQVANVHADAVSAAPRGRIVVAGSTARRIVIARYAWNGDS